MRPRAPYRLDHVHVLVSDRELAAAWYELHLGLQRREVSADPYGPLVLSGDGGGTALALFTSKVKPDPNRVVAFAVGAEELLAFAVDLDERPMQAPDGARLTAADVVDHGDALSYYFKDPDGNAYELACYEVDAARLGLRGLAIRAQRAGR
ncbi:MAG: VOC family protein [Planctomycetes bacterium]|nr:VOC family protein [Planctomycetota bacterium]